jgi:lipopolysaccharide/colanic/teichoic acid biosynthesis glycosyltransferase
MAVKRIIDLTAAVLGIILALPLMLVVAILIKVFSPGPLLHRGPRMGRGGQVFHILKFRTMVVGADKAGVGVTYKGDQRITGIGRVLRTSKLDELPQLFNVLAGQMSLVGSRAEDPRFREIYQDHFPEILELPPGLTSLSWVRMRELDEEKIDPGDDWEKHYREIALPRKLEVDLEYVRRRSIWLDLKIIALTAAALVMRERRET